MANIFDAKNRIRIPHVLFSDGSAEDIDELGCIGLGEEIARPVRKRAVEVNLSIRLQAENVPKLGVDRVGSTVGVAVCGRTHVPAFAA